MYQVINEEIWDLLRATGTKDGSGGDGNPRGLPLMENLQGEVTVAGLSQHEVRVPRVDVSMLVVFYLGT